MSLCDEQKKLIAVNIDDHYVFFAPSVEIWRYCRWAHIVANTARSSFYYYYITPLFFNLSRAFSIYLFVLYRKNVDMTKKSDFNEAEEFFIVFIISLFLCILARCFALNVIFTPRFTITRWPFLRQNIFSLLCASICLLCWDAISNLFIFKLTTLFWNKLFSFGKRQAIKLGNRPSLVRLKIRLESRRWQKNSLLSIDENELSN